MPKGQIVYKNGDQYSGELANGQLSGRGIYKFANGSYYDGQFSCGLFHGRGKLVDVFNDLEMVGDFYQGKANGYCRVHYGDDTQYEGYLLQGIRCGKGTLTYPKNAPEVSFQGCFKDDQPQGQGQLRFRNGDLYRGKFLCGVFEGQGQMSTKDYKYIGPFKNGFMQGKGLIRYSSGETYEGDFSMNEKTGIGKFTYKDGSVHEGSWKNDKKSGRGRLTMGDGSRLEGTFIDGQVQQGTLWSGGWEIRGEFKQGKLDGAVSMRRQGVIGEGRYLGGQKQGLFKFVKKVGGKEISYRGEFKGGRENPYSTFYSGRV